MCFRLTKIPVLRFGPKQRDLKSQRNRRCLLQTHITRVTLRLKVDLIYFQPTGPLVSKSTMPLNQKIARDLTYKHQVLGHTNQEAISNPSNQLRCLFVSTQAKQVGLSRVCSTHPLTSTKCAALNRSKSARILHCIDSFNFGRNVKQCERLAHRNLQTALQIRS